MLGDRNYYPSLYLTAYHLESRPWSGAEPSQQSGEEILEAYDRAETPYI